MYLLCSLAALWLHAKGRLPLKGSVAVFVAISVMAAVYALWALLGAGKEAVLWGFLLLGCAVPVFYTMRYWQKTTRQFQQKNVLRDVKI